MKKYRLIFVFTFLFSLVAKAQTPYVDVLTAPALAIYSSNIKKEQENTVDKMDKLANMQGWVATQMTYANNIQDKLYKGLKEVNGTVRNGLQIKRIYDNLSRSVTNMDAIRREVRDAPEYSIFATKSINVVVNKVTDIYSDAADIINESETNLATAGDRRRLLGSIELNTRLLNVYLMNVKLTIQRAKRKGFWKSLNPFQTYVNTDKALFNQIMRNAGYL